MTAPWTWTNALTLGLLVTVGVVWMAGCFSLVGSWVGLGALLLSPDLYPTTLPVVAPSRLAATLLAGTAFWWLAWKLVVARALSLADAMLNGAGRGADPVHDQIA